ncbi:YodC family protein [Enterobacter asburiae]|uniref:DUF2158 domain-containing protein n=1 Tax=Enterobacter dykesii TaxID=2797506 RepID=A0AAU7J698_9ENTR|nr:MULTISPECIES: DUF2158 domain-containing protein [Enterobacteriaceae]HCM9215059.1 DUF2158 domain-containing protein [Enterobacter kobei]KAA0528919.1 DUF2158 domain-containing protein [Enterobacter asburiae]KAA0532981.1 DUF2158 domain-containing protein [Enterobacter dykesii]MBJ3794708.1 DUF2158 domain-containing protein [Enterobacter asburiae]MDM3469839.1 YodC family protein [Citrobacter sp. Cb041]
MSNSSTERKALFKLGDSVYLKSGGPEMSVYEIHKFGGAFTGDYTCQWFAGKKLEKGRFTEESLTNTNPKP